MIPRMNVKLIRRVNMLDMFADECALSARPGETAKVADLGEIGDLLSQRGNRAFRGED